MTPTTVGTYEFKGSLHSASEYVETKDYREWSRAEVYLNEKSERLCARVFDHDGHYSSNHLSFFSGEWRHSPSTNPVQTPQPMITLPATPSFQITVDLKAQLLAHAVALESAVNYAYPHERFDDDCAHVALQRVDSVTGILRALINSVSIQPLS